MARPSLALLLLVPVAALALAAPGLAAQPLPPDAGVGLFEVDLAPRGDLPDPAIVGYENVLPLEVIVDGPAGLVPPDEVRLRGSDDRGTPLDFTPNPVPLEPGRHRYPVDAAYEPPGAGDPAVQARAEGPLQAREDWTASLPVRPDAVSVAVTDVGSPTSTWDVPLAVTANTTVLPAEQARLVPRVRLAADPPAAWNATPIPANLTPEADAWNLTVPAKFGPGRYQVQVVADGPRSAGEAAPVLVDVEEPDEADGTARVHANVPDRPASLVLTGDSVNEDGKRKYPGQAVITRLEARDPNGLGAARGVAVDVHRETPGGPVHVRETLLPLPDDAWARRTVPVEDRFAWAPLKDGAYVLEARLAGTDADPVHRTFTVRDQQAGLAGGGIPDATATTPPPTLEGEVRVADENLGGGPDGPPVTELETLTATLYRYGHEPDPPAGVTFSGEGAALDLSNTTSEPSNHDYTTEGEAGVFTIPFRVRLPDDPEPDPHYVTFRHHRGSTVEKLGTLHFTVHPAPQVTDLEVGPARPGSNLTAAASVDEPAAAEILRFTLEAEDGTLLARANATLAAAGEPHGEARLPVPRGLPPGADLRVQAVPLLPDGRAGDPAHRTAAVEATPPAVRVAAALDGDPVPRDPIPLVPGAAAEVTLDVHARGHHGDAPEVAAALVDWTEDRVQGAECETTAPGEPASCTLHLPPDLPKGRYTARIEATDPGGTTTRNRSLEAGPWLHVALPGDVALEPDGDDVLAGTFPVTNRGNVPVPHLEVVLGPLQGPGGATWRPPTPDVRLPGAAGVETTPAAGGVRVSAADGPLLAPGEDARIRLALPLQPGLAPGAWVGDLQVTAPMEGFP